MTWGVEAQTARLSTYFNYTALLGIKLIQLSPLKLSFLDYSLGNDVTLEKVLDETHGNTLTTRHRTYVHTELVQFLSFSCLL